MTRLVECVPNVSEGRRRDVVAAMVATVSSVPGVAVLDHSSDADHNRSVFTFAGMPGAVTTATERLVAGAVDAIDMRSHTGQHPRLGAVDVVPFVPLGTTTMAECVVLARAFGAQLAERFDLPVYLYAEAASRPERRLLSDIRRPQFEGLAEAMAAPGGEPDFGPRRPHPTAGATVVGARPFLIAWNIELDSADVGLAKRIARMVRERDGGLPRVQALGLFLEATGRAQVSMNLLDFRVTSLWRVWETVAALAAENGVEPFDSELIGLTPLEALTQTADHLGVETDMAVERRIALAAAYLRLRDFKPSMALELRLGAGGPEPGP